MTWYTLCKCLRCYYCNAPVTITELKDVDEILSTFDGETRELVIDHLPASTHDRAFPFVHETGKRYLVLNLCKKTLNEAARKAGCP